MKVCIDVSAAVHRRAGLGRYAQELVRALVAHVAVRDTAELSVDEREEPVQGLCVAAAPGDQEPGHVCRRGSGQRDLPA